MRIRWTPLAAADLQHVHDYLLEYPRIYHTAKDRA